MPENFTGKDFHCNPIFCHEEVIKSGRKIELKVDQIASTSEDFKEEFSLAVCVCVHLGRWAMRRNGDTEIFSLGLWSRT